MFLLAVKAHINPFAEFQKYSGNEFYATSVNCALGMMIIFLAFKFAVWLFDGQWANCYSVCCGHREIDEIQKFDIDMRIDIR